MPRSFRNCLRHVLFIQAVLILSMEYADVLQRSLLFCSMNGSIKDSQRSLSTMCDSPNCLDTYRNHEPLLGTVDHCGRPTYLRRICSILWSLVMKACRRVSLPTAPTHRLFGALSLQVLVPCPTVDSMYVILYVYVHIHTNTYMYIYI